MKIRTLNFILPLVFFACKKYEEAKPDYQSMFKLTTENSGDVKADANGLVKVSLISDKEDLKDGLKATFETKAGTLNESEKILDAKGNAYTYLKVSQDTSNYFVTVKVKDGDTQLFYYQTRFSPKLAHADSIFVEPDHSTYKLNDDLKFKTLLTRLTGKPSLKLPVEYKAYQLDNLNNPVTVGRFEGLHGNYSDGEGKFTDIHFFTDTPNIDTTKVLTVEAKTQKDNGQFTKATFNFTYKR